MAASSFSIWWKFDETKNGTSKIISYNRDGQYIRLSGNGSPTLRSITAGTRYTSLTHNWSTEQEFLSWHHYVFVQEDNGDAKLYVDGTLSASASNPYTNSVNPSVGTVSTIGDSLMDGRFDEFRSFKRKLTLREVEYLYDGNGIGGRNELLVGPAPIDVPAGVEASAELESVRIAVDLRVDSAQSSSQNLNATLGAVPLLVDDSESPASCSEVDIVVRSFHIDGDPIVVGDLNSSVKERAVLEFSIDEVSTNHPVYLRMEVENVVGGSFAADVHRWTADFPADNDALQQDNFSSVVFTSFTPSVGTVEIDVTDHVSAAKASGESDVRLMLEEQPIGTSRYYEVDSSEAGKPSLSYATVVPFALDGGQATAEIESFGIPIRISADSVQSSSSVSGPDANSQLMPIDSAQSQSATNYVAGMSVGITLASDSSQSSSEVGSLSVSDQFFSYEDFLDFAGTSDPKPDSESPFFSLDWPSYDDTQSSYGGFVGQDSLDDVTFLPVRISGYGELSLSFQLLGPGSVEIRRGGEVIKRIDQNIQYPPTSTSVVLEPGTFDLEFAVIGLGTQFLISRIDLVETTAPVDYDFFIEGSFETGQDNWIEGGGINSRWGRDVWGNAHDGIYSYRGNLLETYRLDAELLRYNVDTTSLGVTEFRFHVFLSGTYNYWGGVSVMVDGVESKRLAAWWSGSDIPTNEWVSVGVELTPGIHMIEMKLDLHPELNNNYVFFDDFGFRQIPAPISVDSVQSSSVNEPVILGVLGIGGSIGDVQSSSETGQVSIGVPVTLDSVQSQSQASNLVLGSHMVIGMDDAESNAIAESPTLSGDAVLLVDSAESRVELRKFNLSISPVDLSSKAQASEPRLGVNHSLQVADLQSLSQASTLAVAGQSVLGVEDAQASSESLAVTAELYYILEVDSAESSAQASPFAVQQVVLIDPDDVSLCTPTGSDESVVSAIAGEDIGKGDVVRVTGEDIVLLAGNSTFVDSIYDGIAITSAAAGEPVVVAVEGTVLLGPVLRPNQLYVLSARKGRIKHVSEISPGEYISLVGIATSSGGLLLGANFQSLLMTNETEEAVSGNSVSVNPGTLSVEGTDAPVAGRSQAEENIGIGDVLNRDQTLAESANVGESSFLGVAVSEAEEECSFAYVGTGTDVDLGTTDLQANQIYVVSRSRGKMMISSELDQGDYATIVGIARSSSVIRLGRIDKGTLAV